MNTFPSCNRKALSSSLFELCSTKSTGTLFIETSQNDTALFILEAGVITNLTLGVKRGLEAISTLKSEIYKHIEFHEGHAEPMTNNSKVDCSQTLLTHLGYDQHIPKDKPASVICYLLA